MVRLQDANGKMPFHTDLSRIEESFFLADSIFDHI